MAHGCIVSCGLTVDLSIVIKCSCSFPFLLLLIVTTTARLVSTSESSALWLSECLCSTKNECLWLSEHGAICAVRAEDDQQGETLSFTCSSSSISLNLHVQRHSDQP